MIRYWAVPIAAVAAFVAIPTSIAYYDYNYIERDYVYSRGIYLPNTHICDDGVLYERQYGAIFNKYGDNVGCITLKMTPVERYDN